MLNKIKEMITSKYVYNFQYKNLINPKTLPSFERDAKSRRKLNQYLIKTTSHNSSCEKCKKWENKILNDDVFNPCIIDPQYPLLSDAIKDGLFHENCMHGIYTYYPELDEITSQYKN